MLSGIVAFKQASVTIKQCYAIGEFFGFAAAPIKPAVIRNIAIHRDKIKLFRITAEGEKQALGFFLLVIAKAEIFA